MLLTVRNQYSFDIIEGKVKQQEKIAVWFPARGKTDELDDILTIAAKNGNYKPLLESFKPIKDGFEVVDFSLNLIN
jgi:hypothetical protein